MWVVSLQEVFLLGFQIIVHADRVFNVIALGGVLIAFLDTSVRCEIVLVLLQGAVTFVCTTTSETPCNLTFKGLGGVRCVGR